MNLDERAWALRSAGLWPARADERELRWLALAAAFGGVFTRDQFAAWAGARRNAGLRLVERVVQQAKLGRERDGGAGVGRYVHLTSRKLYAALGMGDSRHRRVGSPSYLVQRLLALDCVIEHRDAGVWLAGGKERDAFRDIGAQDDVLPKRVYSGSGGKPGSTVWFPARWPVCIGPRDVLFVFPDEEAVERPARSLRTWGRQHAALWAWLRAAGRSPAALFAVRDLDRADAVRSVLAGWTAGGVRSGGVRPQGGDPLAEIRAIEEAVKANDFAVLNPYGSISKALKRRTELLNRAKSSPAAAGVPARLASAGPWLSERLAARARLVGWVEEPPEPVALADVAGAVGG